METEGQAQSRAPTFSFLPELYRAKAGIGCVRGHLSARIFNFSMSALSSADEVAKSTAPLFRLGRVTAIPVFDDPDRNLLILYLAGPGELSGNARKTGAAVGSEAVADQGRRAAQSAATQALGKDPDPFASRTSAIFIWLRE
jgi:hypothetical protein